MNAHQGADALSSRSSSRSGFMETVYAHCARLGLTPLQGIEDTVASPAHQKKRADRAERLREAGEIMFKVVVNPGCNHTDPRHPRNQGCKHCQRRARALDHWDNALIPGTHDA